MTIFAMGLYGLVFAHSHAVTLEITSRSKFSLEPTCFKIAINSKYVSATRSKVTKLDGTLPRQIGSVLRLPGEGYIGLDVLRKRHAVALIHQRVRGNPVRDFMGLYKLKGTVVLVDKDRLSLVKRFDHQGRVALRMQNTKLEAYAFPSRRLSAQEEKELCQALVTISLCEN